MSTSRLRCFWSTRGCEELSNTAQLLVQGSWRPGTEANYSGCWKVWSQHCRRIEVQPYSPSLTDICDFLAVLFDKNLEYRTINNYRSCLSSTLLPMEGFPVGQHPLVIRLMKGINNAKPPTKILVPSWSVKLVLEMLISWGENYSLTLPVSCC